MGWREDVLFLWEEFFLREEDISEKAAASILEGAAGEAGKGLIGSLLG